MPCFNDEGRNKPFMRNFIYLLFANIFMLIGEVGIWLSDGVPNRLPVMKSGLFLSFGCGYLVVIFYVYCLISFIQEKKKASMKMVHTIATVSAFLAILNIGSIFTGIFFYINDAGIFVYKDTYSIVNFSDFLLLLLEIFLVLRYRKLLRRRGTILLLSFSIFPLISMPMQIFWDTTPKCITTTMSLIALYMLFQRELTRQLAEKKKELEHVRHYVNIEQIRFPDMTIRFELYSGEFLLPALTIQPLVENAIKHGLMKLESGGTVMIGTCETEKYYCVSVVDNGVGFEPSILQDESKYIGIRNIRGRLEALCNGILTIESAPGKGTTALIKIPKEDE